MGTSAPEDFEEWYEASHARVLGALTALSGDLDLAAEATDEAFARALSRWGRVGRMDSPRAWTFRVALNELRRRARRRRMERERVAAADGVLAPVPASDPEVWVAVRALPERQRQAVILRYVGDLAEADIAVAMGVTRGTVASTLADARARLKVLLASGEEVRHE